ncbi:hypothetical protein FP803_05325 [Candidatus Woesearchaeota archaeon]|nr:hypothetical protein [Candidatus Woesearchaeota archaeon]
MEETTQFNIRLAKALLYDMEYVAQHYKISRTDWLKYRIAKLVREEKARIIDDFERRFIGGMTTEEDFKKQTGINPTKEMKELRSKVSETPRKYILSILEDIKKRENDKSNNI